MWKRPVSRTAHPGAGIMPASLRITEGVIRDPVNPGLFSDLKSNLPICTGEASAWENGLPTCCQATCCLGVRTPVRVKIHVYVTVKV